MSTVLFEETVNKIANAGEKKIPDKVNQILKYIFDTDKYTIFGSINNTLLISKRYMQYFVVNNDIYNLQYLNQYEIDCLRKFIDRMKGLDVKTYSIVECERITPHIFITKSDNNTYNAYFRASSEVFKICEYKKFFKRLNEYKHVDEIKVGIDPIIYLYYDNDEIEELIKYLSKSKVIYDEYGVVKLSDTFIILKNHNSHIIIRYDKIDEFINRIDDVLKKIEIVVEYNHNVDTDTIVFSNLFPNLPSLNVNIDEFKKMLDSLIPAAKIVDKTITNKLIKDDYVTKLYSLLFYMVKYFATTNDYDLDQATASYIVENSI